MSYTVETITMDEHPNYRARIVVDDYPNEPENDGQSPILRINANRWHGRTADQHVMTTSDQDHARDSRIERAWDHFEEHAPTGVDTEQMFERYLRIFYGVTSVVWEHDPQSDYIYVTYDPAEWREAMGLTDEYLVKHLPDYTITMDEWLAYCRGDVFGIVVEKLETWVKVDAESGNVVEDAEPREDWEEVDSLWGFYGDVDGYTTEEARSLIAAAAA